MPRCLGLPRVASFRGRLDRDRNLLAVSCGVFLVADPGIAAFSLAFLLGVGVAAFSIAFLLGVDFWLVFPFTISWGTAPLILRRNSSSGGSSSSLDE